MSSFAVQPVLCSPPSYSKTKIQPPPYKDAEPANFPAAMPRMSSFNPFTSIKRAFTNSAASTSNASIAISTIDTGSSHTPTSHSPQPSENLRSPAVPPPTFSPIASPKPPAYTAAPSPAVTRSNTMIISEQPRLSQACGPLFDFSGEEWETEERRRYEAREAAQRERQEQGCCASWWNVGPNPLPWAAYYVF